ncbi:MAG: glutamate synthase, partial [Calditrichaeota bacterium]
MGKPTGFMEYARELPQDRPPKERVKDWNEFHLPMAPEKLQIQGARCMECGIPFC